MRPFLRPLLRGFAASSILVAAACDDPADPAEAPPSGIEFADSWFIVHTRASVGWGSTFLDEQQGDTVLGQRGVSHNVAAAVSHDTAGSAGATATMSAAISPDDHAHVASITWNGESSAYAHSLEGYPGSDAQGSGGIEFEVVDTTVSVRLLSATEATPRDTLERSRFEVAFVHIWLRRIDPTTRVVIEEYFRQESEIASGQATEIPLDLARGYYALLIQFRAFVPSCDEDDCTLDAESAFAFTLTTE